MAQFNAQREAQQLRSIQDVLVKPAGMEIPKIDLKVDKDTGDYLSQIGKLSQEQQKKPADAGGLRLAPIVISDLLGPGGRSLADAKKLVDQERFQEALAPLESAIRESQGALHEAVYLKGVCLTKLQRPEPALEALGVLRGSRLAPKIATHVKVLYDEIRTMLFVPVMLENLLLTRTGQTDPACRRLRRLVDLDPEAGLYHFMLAGTLLSGDRLEEASAAVETGLAHTKGDDKKRLTTLKEQIDRRDLERRLEPARDLYRRGNYPRARAAIQRLPAALQTRTLWKTFNDYLEDLGGGLFGLIKGKSVDDVKPKGRFKDVDALHFLLIGDEIRRAKALMNSGQPDDAETVLQTGLCYAPHFPYAHYLTGLCIYQSVAASIGGQRAESIDDAIDRIGAAAVHAKMATKDPDISGANEFVEAVAQAGTALESVRERLRARQEEVRRVNAAIEEFQAIMALAGEGITSAAQYREIRDRVAALRGNLGDVGRQVSSPEGREALKQLKDSVDRSHKQLADMSGDIEESERVKALMDEFQSIMSSDRGPMRSPTGLADTERRLGALRDNARALQRKVSNADARNVLKQIEEGAVRTLSQIAEAKSASAEAGPVNEAVHRFNELMEGVKEGIRSREQFGRFLMGMMQLKEELPRIERQLRTEASRRNLRQLREAVDKVLDQAAKAG